MPIEVNRLSKIVKGMCCPSCAADSKAIYLMTGGRHGGHPEDTHAPTGAAQ